MIEPTKRDREIAINILANDIANRDNGRHGDERIGDAAHRIAAYREELFVVFQAAQDEIDKLLAASAQSAEPLMSDGRTRNQFINDQYAESAEPQETETLIDIRHRLYAEAEERSGGWSKWTPNEAFKTGFESGIDATFYALRARLASKPSREEGMWEQIERIKHDCENALRSSTHHKCDYLSLIQSINDRLAYAVLAQGGAWDEGEGKR